MFRPRVAVLIAVLLTMHVINLRADQSDEIGRYTITSFSPRIYGASPQVWAVAQDKRGVMYFGDTEGILEYDGSTWRKIPIPNGIVRALASDSHGHIYVGGDGVLGRLEADREGKTFFVSLADRIPKQYRQFGIILNALTASDGIYFNSRTRLFRFRENGTVDVWHVAGGLRHVLFQARGQIYLSSAKDGALTLQNNRLVPFAWSKDFKTNLITGFEWNGVVLLASADRLYKIHQQAIQSFPTPADEYLQKHKISLLDRLPNGDLAIGTRSGGLVVLDAEMHSVRFATQTSGLPNNYVSGFLGSTKDGIWITTEGGMAHFVPNLTKFWEVQGIKGDVYSIGREAGVLYVGSSVGLARLQTSSSNEAFFETVLESVGKVLAITQVGDSSLVGTDVGLYSISGRNITEVLRSAVIFDVQTSLHDSSLVYTAGREGVQALRREGATWKVLAQAKGEGQDFRTVSEDNDGKVWSTTTLDIWRFDLRSNPVKAERFDKSNGVPDGWKNVYRLRGHIVFATEKGLMVFSESKQRLVADPELGAEFSDGKKPIFLLQEDAQKTVWISGKGYHGFIRKLPSGKSEWTEMPLLASGIEDLWALHIDKDGTTWASGSEGGLFRWAPHQSDGQKQDFKVLVRDLRVAESKTILFGGDGPQPTALKIPYRENALRFEFAAPFYEAPDAVQYQFRLDKNDREWSPWTTEAHKDFTNLPPHNFQFRVRARSPHGAISPEATLAFRVLPPWYRTWWSYCLYFIGAVLFGWLIVRWRLKVLRAHNQHLEKVVLERTLEVRTQRDQNEALLLNILPAPVAAELRDHGSVTPTNFEDVTVCFTDFVGFTLSSEKLSADHLVTALNEYFTAFDAIMARYGLEKLKTIGDSYMFASGLPERRASHAVDAVLAAIEMLHASKLLSNPDRETDWRMRVGLYSGPVVAGVVGKSKFAFDIWGNTVNLASRMESSGAADRINLSSSTCSHVGQFIECESRGPVRIKEGRTMEMHFVVGIKPELVRGPLVDGIPKAFRDQYWAVFSELPRSFPAFLVQTEPALMAD